ncbi:hypothetical protein PRIPAC_89826 [Pristionchus pacificus]|uniref:G protein-coupled receptor n=1 Tax=Pristionchus pacificus TaxID=54126 RepID=A0A2A6CU07_PRIPA|nr:hypothetical protein PRIPAC_89826 [Pristionchus pacificus]|eukprot:PDM81521.1 G protein-coupled receptor [Pristionchus pacificus]
MSRTRKLLIAYGYCIVIICVSAPYSQSFINEKAWEPHVQAVVRQIQNIEPDEPVYAYASTTKEIAENNYRTVMPFVFIGTLPSYVWSYGAFIVTTVVIARALRSHGIKLSKRTMAMQRRFLRMLIIQGLVPLGVTGVPMSIFIGTMILGVSMDRWSILHTAAIHFVPIVQAVVSFAFVRRLKRNSAPSSDNRKEVTEHQQGVVWATSAL